MLTGRASRVVAVSGAAVLCLAACTGNSSTTETTSQTASPAAASSSAATSSAASSTAASEGLTSIPGLPQEALDVMNQPQYALGQWAISVRDIDTGGKWKAVSEADLLIVHLVAPKTAAEPAAAEAAPAAATAEPEVIKKGKAEKEGEKE